MKIIVSGREFELPDFTEPLDQAFLDLYAAYFGGNAVDWSRFQTAAETFFSNFPSRLFWKDHNRFFGSFVNYLWRPHLINGRFVEAERVWEFALKPALNVEKKKGFEIHKGTPFYFWGATAILRGDLDKGFALMHQALEEDKLTVPHIYKKQPAYAFASLDFQNPEQAFKQWVDQHAEFLKGLIKEYSSTHNPKYDLDSFRTKFLTAPPTDDDLFRFTYCLARFKHFYDFRDYCVSSAFASMLQAIILSDLAILLEDMLAKKLNMPGCMLKALTERFLSTIGQPLCLDDINASRKTNFDSTLTNILNGSFKLKKSPGLSGLQIDVAIAYVIRNQALHNVFTSTVIRQNFYKVGSALFNVLFAAVDYI